VGDGSTADQTDPVNVGNLGDAMAIAAGESHNCVLISSGAVRCWGDNSYGQLGDGTATNRTSAVQVIGFGVSGSGGGVPPAPVNVSVSNTGSVSWSSVLGATGYVVYASTGSVSKSTYMIRVTSTGSPVDVDGLTAYMYWNFVVTAENAYGEGPESPVVTICVQVPSQPTVLCN
jgi:alpha-tubulin suppressor-like RCC1 family protein